MKALLLTEPGKFQVADVPVPAVGPDEVRVRVRSSGICGSDVHGFDGSTGRRVPPLIMGHEAAGVVAEVGRNVTQFKPGDRVTFDSTVYCGRCFFCRRGQINLCDRRQVLGVATGEHRRDGAFAEYLCVPQHIVYAISDAMTFEQAALIEPTSIAMHAVNRTPITLGDTAAVVGIGMIGLLVVQALRLAGCGRIIAIDLDDEKLQLAREFGADEALNASDGDVAAKVCAMTDGRGADIAAEVVGLSATFNTALACVRKGGHVVLVGNVAPSVALPLQALVTREQTLIASCASAGEYPACIDAIVRGAIKVNPLISAIAPLDEGAAWFDRLHRREPGLMKVILQP